MESTSVLTTLASIVTQVTTTMGQVATTIAGNELMLLATGLSFVAGSVKIVKHLILGRG